MDKNFEKLNDAALENAVGGAGGGYCFVAGDVYERNGYYYVVVYDYSGTNAMYPVSVREYSFENGEYVCEGDDTITAQALDNMTKMDIIIE